MTDQLGYEVFLNQGPLQTTGLLPNGELRRFSPIASTLIRGRKQAVLTDPGFTITQADALAEWVAGKDVDVTDIVITHGHGDHWFAADVLADWFGARIVASPGTIAQMHANAAARRLLWDTVYDDIPPSPVTAVPVPDNTLTLEGHELRIVDVGQTDIDDSTVLHVPDLGLVVAGDVIYNGAHQYVGSALGPDGFGPWRDAIAKVEALRPRRIVAGHQNRLGDDAVRTIAGTRRYLDVAEEFLRTKPTALDYFTAMIERYPDYAGRLILWAGAGVQYGVREPSGIDRLKVVVSAWQ
ncbi:MBL fold metallo-hydrolase [Kribbella sp. CA-247076]|uniref:MBL fold metallo-hydrolase n=1 Tax=Kribbella sp. CA-247076 TaxID=3239941 RepID=UPI003D8B0CD8